VRRVIDGLFKPKANASLAGTTSGKNIACQHDDLVVRTMPVVKDEIYATLRHRVAGTECFHFKKVPLQNITGIAEPLLLMN
jgi:hypothetical protein